MRITVQLDGVLLRNAMKSAGTKDASVVLNRALKAFIHMEASRRLAEAGGSEPNLKKIKRTRADDL